MGSPLCEFVQASALVGLRPAKQIFLRNAEAGIVASARKKVCFAQCVGSAWRSFLIFFLLGLRRPCYHVRLFELADESTRSRVLPSGAEKPGSAPALFFASSVLCSTHFCEKLL